MSPTTLQHQPPASVEHLRLPRVWHGPRPRHLVGHLSPASTHDITGSAASVATSLSQLAGHDGCVAVNLHRLLHSLRQGEGQVIALQVLLMLAVYATSAAGSAIGAGAGGCRRPALPVDASRCNSRVCAACQPCIQAAPLAPQADKLRTGRAAAAAVAWGGARFTAARAGRPLSFAQSPHAGATRRRHGAP